MGPARSGGLPSNKLGLSVERAAHDQQGIEPSRPTNTRMSAAVERISPPTTRCPPPARATFPRKFTGFARRTALCVGPMSYPRLIELFATGQIHPRTELSRESGKFREALHFNELARFVTSPALRWDEELHGQRGAHVSSIAPRLPSYLFQMALERDTGALIFRDQQRRKKIYLVEGAARVRGVDRQARVARRIFGRHAGKCCAWKSTWRSRCCRASEVVSATRS